MGTPIAIALGILWMEGWITTLKDFEQIIVSLPQVAGAVLAGTAGSVGNVLLNKYLGVSDNIAAVAGFGVDAASKAVMTATLIAALSVLGFDLYPAGLTE
jgi:hypothetical protein